MNIIDIGDEPMQRLDQQNFFVRPAKDVAKDLLGKFICRKAEGGLVNRWRITETEAYAADCPYIFKEPPFYTVGEWVAHENMLMITCCSGEGPDNVVIGSVDGYNGSNAVTKAVGVVSGEAYPHDMLWLEDDGTVVVFVAGERSFLPDGDLVNFRVVEQAI